MRAPVPVPSGTIPLADARKTLEALIQLYKEIGPGKRVALSKLAVEKFEETGRPLRIAIDTSIWLFQIQASKGQHLPFRACLSYAKRE